MANERRIEDYEAWRAALLPRLRAIRCELRNARVRRPPCTRVQDAEELRVLHQCRERRCARLAAAGVLVQTGPRAWRLTLPSGGNCSVCADESHEARDGAGETKKTKGDK